MAFNNDILAGNKLVREAMESPNFLTGVSGWQVTKLGDAEFNQLITRGEFSNVGPVSTARLVDGHFLVFTNSVPDLAFALMEPNNIQLQEPAGGQAAIRLDTSAGNLGVFCGAALEGFVIDGTNGFIYKTLDGFAIRDWVSIPISSGSAVLTNGPEAKLLPDGTVLCRGGISGHGTAAGTVIATLPSGLRPARRGNWTVEGGGSGAANAVSVETNGQIIIQRGPVTGSYLTPIHFSTI